MPTSCSPHGMLNQSQSRPFKNYFTLVVTYVKGLNTHISSQNIRRAVEFSLCGLRVPQSHGFKGCPFSEKCVALTVCLYVLDRDAVVMLIRRMPPLLGGTEGGSVNTTTKERHN